VGIASNDNDYGDHAYTCDYCHELASKPAEFWDDRTQMGVCEHCIRNYGLETIENWVAGLRSISDESGI